jgi:hypothetical protein
MKTGTVDILMATCNGERFLEQQIASLFAQTRNDFRLLIRDDASNDGTPLLLSSLVARHGGKIEVLAPSTQREGAVRTFDALLQHAEADYMMFCDQDDIWLRHKISLCMARMAQLEQRYGACTPILIHTDLMVAGTNLELLGSSFAAYQNLNLRCSRLNRLLMQNVVTGCTVTINKALKTKVDRIPQEARMHDWWLALVASIFGIVDYIEMPTVLYRQHTGNSVGAKRLSPRLVVDKMRSTRRVKAGLQETIRQANAVLHRYGEDMPATCRNLCHAFSALEKASWPVKRSTILKYRFFKQGFFRNLGMLSI